MRLLDLVRLALAALYQQKLRTLLTSLGVLFGTFVLIFSFSAGKGVQDTIAREYSRYAELRQIEVIPSYELPQVSEDLDKIEVKGVMSDEKRQRLRAEIRRHQLQESVRTQMAKLTPSELARLQQIPHVQSVTPDVDLYGRVLLHGKAEAVYVHSAVPEQKQLQGRVVTGAFLSSRDGHEAVVTEHLLYRFGIADDAAVQAVLGQKLRFIYRHGPPKPNLLLMVLGAAQNRVGLDEQTLLDKVVKQLPAALERMNLTPAEKVLLRKALKPTAESRQVENVEVIREFTIVGVLRASQKADPRPYRAWWVENVDVVVPVDAAAEQFFAVPANRENGVNRLQLEADDPANVKEVAKEITALGLRSFSMVEMIEREQFTYLLLFAVMNCIAGVALLVAALGIINTMLMSVLERTREIGVMKAVGARNRHIQSIFLVEGALIGAAGGLMGLLAAWGASVPGDAWARSLVAERLNVELAESLFVWPGWLVVGGPLFACVVTTMAAVYPARRAARVNPIAALRHE